MPQDATMNTGIQRTANTLVIGTNSSLVMGAGSKITLEEFGPTQNAPTANMLDDERMARLRHSRITLTNLVMSTTDATTNGAAGNVKLFTFPRGFLRFYGASCNLTVVGDGTGVTSTSAVVTSIGTAPAAADATLTSTEANIIASTTSTLTASAGVMKGKPTTDFQVDNSTTTNATILAAYLNAAMPDAGSTANGTLTFNGTIDIFWQNFGDN